MITLKKGKKDSRLPVHGGDENGNIDDRNTESILNSSSQLNSPIDRAVQAEAEKSENIQLAIELG